MIKYKKSKTAIIKLLHWQYDLIISADEEKAFDKLQYQFRNKIGMEGIYINTKAIHENLTAKMIINGEKLKAFLLRSKTKQECWLSPLLLNTELKVLNREFRYQIMAETSHVQKNQSYRFRKLRKCQ